MNQNEKSAEGLQWWIDEQREMKRSAEDRLVRLRQQRERLVSYSARPNELTTLNDVIKREEAAVDHFGKSIAFSETLLGLAECNSLHDPRRG